MTTPYGDLPTWEELGRLTRWADRGCPPVAPRQFPDERPEDAFRILLRLLKSLPQHLPHYAYGTPEWRAELERLRQEAEDQEEAIGDGQEGPR